ncbi:hypothetical protein N9L68_04685 [bacterium]|nr:hypothetical protein [bacterium]
MRVRPRVEPILPCHPRTKKETRHQYDGGEDDDDDDDDDAAIAHMDSFLTSQHHILMASLLSACPPSIRAAQIQARSKGT